MILSTGRRFVFIHIPKTGGTSLAMALEARAMKDDILLGDTPKAHRRRRRLNTVAARGRLWKHATMADIDGLVPGPDLEGLFAFTLVRNPWDRAVSYYHWLQGQSFDHPAVDLARRLPFDAFATHAQTRDGFRAWPAARYMRRADGVEQCSAYIRIERFERDAASLMAHLGFDLTLPRLNASQRDRDYRRYYTDAAADAVADSCAEDIARFGYGFGALDPAG
ncbi:sulfotransferase family protein [Sedimentitalea nanhaiensis]|uniref:Sulfotransferase family protein n=1 Tax=Sedimentitalea nanhaiensis TaxID=999627 RepID=A0A1I7B1N0_9RHOB|nr:sulfotransferase family 2 domain-containing protein [Sedimentitalea nanhaiensis]SFT81099.1 Sulfotransferase family protein [Sedimentitalea nanhaiensis]